ncbi:PPOX class F420-dependent oxidoreductase [Actinoallomurus purpureus]|uniref:PPOX class F420-dependent oxidoreductase n=1 Tax=Actinoallomurus purpureus TaxID=478114 RepID=UPI002092F882|nr:PPOX class F420-dependent oxidoreductase [Actinoallomurus purpureus]MCO6006284.1 PPOX class F420-dependent oxidoreductase [Actinoallomurus purpureus]
MVFTDRERAYLTGQNLGRLATVAPDGTVQVRPVGFRLNADDTIDIGGPNMSASQKYRNARANPVVAFVVDDMTPDEPGEVRPGWGRGVEIRGRAETMIVEEPPLAPGFFSNEVIRIQPRRVNSWHIDPDHPDLLSRNVD